MTRRNIGPTSTASCRVQTFASPCSSSRRATLLAFPELLERDDVKVSAELPMARNAAVLRPLGRGVCSNCREVRPLKAVGKRALCRECAGGVE